MWTAIPLMPAPRSSTSPVWIPARASIPRCWSASTIAIAQRIAYGLDLSLFQFDYDQSFAAFLMNADKPIYGRFGTRSGRPDFADA